MFLILGTSKCKYCHMAKQLLDQIPYRYIDLEEMYPDWRSVFNVLRPYIGSQRSIPLVFKGCKEAVEEGNFGYLRFVGGYADLVNTLQKDYNLGGV